MTIHETEWARITQAEKSGGQVSDPAEKASVWGKGGPSTILKPEKDVEQVWGWFDLHIPYHDVSLFNASLRALKEQQPDHLILGGDGMDLPLISRWTATQRERMQWYEVDAQLQEERHTWFACLDAIRNVYSGPMSYTWGNHCERLDSWLPRDTAADWMGLTTNHIQVHNRAGFHIRPGHLCLHGDYASTNATKKHWDAHGDSGWHGHVHRYQVHSKAYPSGKMEEWVGAPAMCRTDMDYGPGGAGNGNWHQGWLLGAFDRKRCLGTDVAKWDGEYLAVRGERY